jgi:hypothetical protein
MKEIIRKVLIVFIITIVPAVEGFSGEGHSEGKKTEKPKKKICCKMVLPKPEPGPWTILNQIKVKVCKEVPATAECK